MRGLGLVDRLIELGVIDGRESEVRLWLSYDDKVAILDAIKKSGKEAIGDISKGGVTLYSSALRQAVGHDAIFLERAFLSTALPPRSDLLKYVGPVKILLVWSDHSFPDGNVPAIDSYSPFADRAKYQSPVITKKDPVIYGSRFVATMQFRTPLKVLEQHGRIERCNTHELPRIVQDNWQGIWTVKATSLREFGIDIDFSVGEMASEIGPVPNDGGDFLRCMILLKRIARCNSTIVEKSELMSFAATLYGFDGHSFGAYIEKWGGPRAVLGRLTSW